MIVITGAAGEPGSKTAEYVLARNKRVRVTGRSAEALKWLGEKGAEVLEGDESDETFLTKAFTGAEAVCLLTPGKPEEDGKVDCYHTTVDAAVNAVKKSQTRKVVLLSCRMPESDPGTAAIPGMQDVEGKLSALKDIDVVILRAGYVLENMLAYRKRFKTRKFSEKRRSPNSSIPMVTSREIGAKIAELIDAPDLKGHSFVNLHGEKWFCYF
jgi:uncharacterized protein YbjT (DUF2867 family)